MNTLVAGTSALRDVQQHALKAMAWARALSRSRVGARESACKPLKVAALADVVVREPPQRLRLSLTDARRPGCQRLSVSPHLRPSAVPSGGHVLSPLVATSLPTVRACESGQRNDLTPLAGEGRLGRGGSCRSRRCADRQACSRDPLGLERQPAARAELLRCGTHPAMLRVATLRMTRLSHYRSTIGRRLRRPSPDSVGPWAIVGVGAFGLGVARNAGRTSALSTLGTDLRRRCSSFRADTEAPSLPSTQASGIRTGTGIPSSSGACQVG
jgi:hypothetical protein